MSAQDDLTYLAETLAFEGTPLGDRFDRTSLMRETLELAAHPAISPLVGTVRVEEASPRATSFDARATPSCGLVRFAPIGQRRLTGVHELSHLAHWRSKLGGTGHGPEYRAVYVSMVAICYGVRYADLLRHAFHEAGADVALFAIPCPPTPVIDLDRLADASGGRRWL